MAPILSDDNKSHKLALVSGTNGSVLQGYILVKDIWSVSENERVKMITILNVCLLRPSTAVS